jgi:dolichol-phosphate mannosyltransferase
VLRVFFDETIGNRPILTIGVLLAVVGIQLLVFGLLAELQVFMRHRSNDVKTRPLTK